MHVVDQSDLVSPEPELAATLATCEVRMLQIGLQLCFILLCTLDPAHRRVKNKASIGVTLKISVQLKSHY